MREIKLRAWHKILNEMLTEDEWLHYGPALIGGEIISDDHIIMQYTGIKDKNGKEIYEGDIVKSACMKKYRTPFYIDEVVFDKNCWMLKNNKTYLKDNFSLTNIEVIGNIYEDPELINETPTNE